MGRSVVAELNMHLVNIMPKNRPNDSDEVSSAYYWQEASWSWLGKTKEYGTPTRNSLSDLMESRILNGFRQIGIMTWDMSYTIANPKDYKCSNSTSCIRASEALVAKCG